MNDAGLLHRLQRGRDVFPAAVDGGAAERLAVGRERIGIVEVDHSRAVAKTAGQIDAELLDDVALDLGNCDFQHHLIAAANDDGIHDLAALRNADLVGIVEHPDRDIVSLLRLRGIRHGTGEDNALADAFGIDIGIGDRLLDRGTQAVEIALHGNIEAGDLLACRVEEENVGLTDGNTDDVGTARRSHHRIGDLRIGDQDVFDIARQIDHRRLAGAQRHVPRGAVAGGNSHSLSGRRVERDAAGDGECQHGEQCDNEAHRGRRPGLCACRHRNSLRTHHRPAAEMVLTPNRTVCIDEP